MNFEIRSSNFVKIEKILSEENNYKYNWNNCSANWNFLLFRIGI